LKILTIQEIALQELGFKTLESQRSDALDFRSVACWQVQRALEVAYAQGYQAAERAAKERAKSAAAERTGT